MMSYRCLVLCSPPTISKYGSLSTRFYSRGWGWGVGGGTLGFTLKMFEVDIQFPDDTRSNLKVSKFQQFPGVCLQTPRGMYSTCNIAFRSVDQSGHWVFDQKFVQKVTFLADTN